MASALLRSSDIKCFKKLEHDRTAFYLVGVQNCEIFKLKIGKQYANDLAILQKKAIVNKIDWYTPSDASNNDIACSSVSEKLKTALNILNKLRLKVDSKFFSHSKSSLTVKPSTRLSTHSKFIKSLSFIVKQLITAIGSLKIQANLTLGLFKNNYTSRKRDDMAFRQAGTAHTLLADFIVWYVFVKNRASDKFIKRLNNNKPIFSSPNGEFNIQVTHSLTGSNNITRNYSQNAILNRLITFVNTNIAHYRDCEINQENNHQSGKIVNCFEQYHIL